MKYQCPKCKSTDTLYVTVSTLARLDQYEDEQYGFNMETEPVGDHYWDDESTAYCDNCGWTGVFAQLTHKE